MPHTKLKIVSIILIIEGAFSLLAGLIFVALALLASDILMELLLADSTAEGAVKLIIWFTAAFYLIRSGLELYAGIAGARFSNGSIGEVRRSPAVILSVLHGVDFVVRLVTENFSRLLRPVLWLAVLGVYFAFVTKVEDYNKTRPTVEDEPLFHLKDGY